MIIREKKGMTLIELLAVIAIIAILFVLLIPQISSAIEKSRVTGVQVDLRDYQRGLQSYLMENEIEDATEEKINKELDKNLQFTANESKEKNPWGNKYYLDISKNELKVVTYNKDKKQKEYYVAAKSENGEITFDTTTKGQEVDTETVQPSKDIMCAKRKITESPKENFTLEESTVADGWKISAYVGTETDIVVPCEIDGRKVVEIGRSIFRGEAIKTLTLNDNILSIGLETVENTSIQTLEIPGSIKTISSSAIRNNKNLKTIKFNEGLETIGSNAASWNQNLANINIPNSVKDIESMAFYETNIELVEIGEKSKMTEIKAQAFYGAKVRKVKLAKSNITKIGEAAFYNGYMNILELPEKLETLESTAFGLDTYKANVPEKLDTEEIIMPLTLKRIDQSRGFDNLGAKKIVLNEGLEYLNVSAIVGNKITEITIPSTLTEVSGMFSEGNFPNLKVIYNKSNIDNDKFAYPWNNIPVVKQ